MLFRGPRAVDAGALRVIQQGLETAPKKTLRNCPKESVDEMGDTRYPSRTDSRPNGAKELLLESDADLKR
jgi:hypothetical protein